MGKRKIGGASGPSNTKCPKKIKTVAIQSRVHATMGNETLEALIVLKTKNSACHEAELSNDLLNLKKCKSTIVAELCLQRDV